MENLEWLQKWYAKRLDGDWEHQYGVSIATLDNPGWTITIDLTGTEMDGFPVVPSGSENSEEDWYRIWVDNQNRFRAVGDPGKLKYLIERFKQYVESAESQIR